MKPFLSYLKETEDSQNNILITFSGMNIPTYSDIKFIEHVVNTSKKQNFEHAIFLNDIQDSKNNPLSCEQKINYLSKIFPEVNFVNPINDYNFIIDKLNEHYDNVYEIPYIMENNNTLLEYVKNNNFYKFSKQVPFNDIHIIEELFEDIRMGMGYHNDTSRGMYKAIFVTGGPGSGKDVIIRHSIPESHITELNTVQAYNYLADKQKLSEKSSDLRREAIRNRMPLVINGPADDKSSINYIKEELEELGYSTMMVFVDTTDQTSKDRNQRLSKMMVESIRHDRWMQSQENKRTFSESFDEFIYFDNTKSYEENTKIISETYKKINNYLNNRASSKSMFVVEGNDIKLKKFNFRAERPDDIPPDNRGDEPQADDIKYDAPKKRKTYTFRTYSESKEPTLSVKSKPKEPRFQLDNDKKNRLKKGDTSLSQQRMIRPSGIGGEYDTRAGGQGAAAGAGLGNQTYSEDYVGQEYSNDDVINFAAKTPGPQPNPLSNQYDTKKNIFKKKYGMKKEAIDDPGAVDMGVGGVLGGSMNKEPMQSYKDQERNIGITIKKNKKGKK